MKKGLDLYQVDAFARRLFEGNPAAVVPLEAWLPDAVMQAIAMENNLSETAFFVLQEQGYHLRWFTPAVEVDFCGHATLAASHVLYEELGYAGNRIDFRTRVGRVSVSRVPTGYEMDAPADMLEKITVPPPLEEALGIKIEELYQGREDLLAIVGSEQHIKGLEPDFALLARHTPRGILVSAEGNNEDFVSRCFFPNAGVNEDPVTGSAHTTMAPYWGKRLGKNVLEARQLSARGGQIQCRLEGDRVRLSGQAVTYLRGKIYLPE